MPVEEKTGNIAVMAAYMPEALGKLAQCASGGVRPDSLSHKKQCHAFLSWLIIKRFRLIHR